MCFPNHTDSLQRGRLLTRTIFIILTILSSLSGQTVAISQVPDRLKFTFFSVKDGLPHPTINAMTQDRQGFLWINTPDGISRFDGHTFKTFLNADSAKTGLRLGANASTVDNQNRLWVIQMPTVAWFDRKNDRFRSVVNPFADRKIIHETALYFDETTHWLWIASSTGLIRLNTDTFRFEKLPINHFIRVHDMLDDGWGNVVVIDSDGGVFVVNKQTGKYKKYPIYGVKAFRDYQKNIWIGQWRGESNLIKFNTQTGKHQVFKNPYLFPTSSLAIVPRLTGDTLLWVGLRDQGFALFNIKTGQWTRHYSFQNLQEMGFQGRRVVRQYVDRKGNLWISTDLDLTQLDPSNQTFINEKLPGFDAHTQESITAVIPVPTQPRYWWVQMNYDGLIYYDRQEGKVLNHFFARPKERIDALNVVLNMTYDKQGRLWTGTDAGVVVYDRTPRVILKIPLPPTKRIMFGDDGRIWIGTAKGLFCYDEKTGMQRVFKHQTNQTNGLISNFINNLLLNGNVLWVATDDGFNRFDLKTEKWQQFRFPISGSNSSEARRHSFDTNQLLDIIKDPTHNWLWIGTYDGLMRFDIGTRSFRRYGFRDGLRSETAMTLVFDRRGFLWVNSGSSLHRLDPQTNRFTRFDENDGLYSSGTLGGMLTADHTGKLYVPFDDYHLTSFRPDDIARLRPAVKPVFTGFTVLDQRQSMTFDSIDRRPVRIRNDQNVLTFAFSCLDFTQPEKITFDYQLVGFNQRWLSAGSNRQVTYTNLDDGEYTFQVRAINAVGQRSEPALFRLEVWRPFWQKPWFIGLVAVLVTALGLWALFRYRYEQQLRLLQLRSTLARDLHDDMGSYLSSISIMSQNVETMAQHNPEKAGESLKRIGETARKVMDSMSEIVWSVNPEYDSMEHIVGRMKDEAGELFGAQDTVVRFVVSAEALALALPVEKRRHFFLIYKEALNNSAKYAQANQITIRLQTKANSLGRPGLILHIQDDGIGFDPHQLPSPNGRGNGLKNMQARAQKVEGHLTIETAAGQGCSITLTIPS